MNIADGTKVGLLERDGALFFTEVVAGRFLALPPLKGFVATNRRGLCLVWIFVEGQGERTIKRGRKNQAGAFVLAPDEEFSISEPGEDCRKYRFVAKEQIRVEAPGDQRCDFCREPLHGLGTICPGRGSASVESAEILCRACARAEVWRL